MDREYWYDFVAGWVGGCAGLLIGQPLDTVKVRQQTMGNITARKGITNIFRYEGVRGYYKGMAFPLLATGTLNSLFFGAYGTTMRCLSDGTSPPTYGAIFLSGCVGGFVQLSVACPIDLVKIKMQMQTGSGQNQRVWGTHYESKYKGPTACLKDIYRRGGIKGCYHGINSMFLRDVIASALYFVLYETMVDRTNGLSTPSILWAGGMAGVISWATILPLDVVKSRIQGDNPINPKYKSSVDCFVKSYKQEGWRVFTKGFTMMSLRAFPTNAAIFLGYETSLSFLRKVFSPNEK